jgi:C-terminal processing protease CtpA/Prc
MRSRPRGRAAQVLVRASLLLVLLGGGSAPGAGAAPPATAPAAEAAATGAAGDATNLDGGEVERLAQVAKLWGLVRYLHPFLAYKTIDWDRAWAAAVPAIRAARTPAAFAAAIDGMLAALDDPATRVLRPGTETPASQAGGEPRALAAAPAAPAAPVAGAAGVAPALAHWAAEGVLVVDLRPYANEHGGELAGRLPELGRDLAAARAVVIDLRAAPADKTRRRDHSEALAVLAPRLISRPLRAPVERVVFRSGFVPPEGTSYAYSFGFLSLAALSFEPAAQSPAAESSAPSAPAAPPAPSNAPATGVPAPPGTPKASRRVVFAVDRTTRLPAFALAMQASGEGFLAAPVQLTDETLTRRQYFELAGGGLVAVRTGELVPRPGWAGVHADLVVEHGDLLAAAVDLARRGPQPERSAGPEPEHLAGPAPAARPRPGAAAAEARDVADAAAGSQGAVWRPDAAYPEMLYPPLAYRLLAVVRAWNVIHSFYPYLSLIDDWDPVLPAYLRKIAAVRDAGEYALAIAEMMTGVADSHTTLTGHPGLAAIFGESFAPFSMRWIEGQYVVTGLADNAEMRSAGVEVGDVVAAVDGEPVAARVARYARFVAASTPPNLMAKLSYYLLSGPTGSAFTVALRGRGDAGKTVSLHRIQRPYWGDFEARGPVVRLLPGNVGYADLTRLLPAEVDAMFERLKATRAIVFDLRGYPHGTIFAIAPRLNVRHARAAARFRRPELTGLSFQEGEPGFDFQQEMPPAAGWTYTGKTVVLIDERAVSQSEHSCLWLETANGSRFIGSPTSGGNGDVTFFTLPGNIRVRFSGHEVRHADGRQLQRLGIQPDVPVAPTIAGIRAGRDEVLDRALAYLDGGEPR